MILKPWLPSTPLEEIDFSNTELWVQVHNMPLDHLTEDNAKDIGLLFKRLIDIEIPEHYHTTGPPFLRLKVKHPIEDPLHSGFFMEREHHPRHWVQFQYERVYDFCFNCGRLGHIAHSCPIKLVSDTLKKGSKHEKQSLGPWMLVPRKSNSSTNFNASNPNRKKEEANHTSQAKAEQAARGLQSLAAREARNPTPSIETPDGKSTSPYSPEIKTPLNPPLTADLSLKTPDLPLLDTPCTNLISEAPETLPTVFGSISKNTNTINGPKVDKPGPLTSPLCQKPPSPIQGPPSSLKPQSQNPEGQHNPLTSIHFYTRVKNPKLKLHHHQKESSQPRPESQAHSPS